ncbi:MAG: hypothetical protein H0X30_29165 [Anaerolineae bacterium]|nr:hypothetical protein [Anaerolineae bacterium]
MVNRFVLMVMISFSIAVGGVQAQANNTPIIAVSKGDIYTINPADGSIKQLTHHPSIAGGASPYSQRDLSISPDGQYLAYLQTPRVFAIAMKNNLVGNFGFPPSDIVLLNVATGEEKVIAEQQTNVKWSDSPRLWYRENLTWSPDSAQIAYYQYRGGSTYQVMIYDWLIEKTFTFVDSKQPLGEIAWLTEGISVGSVVYNTNSEIIAQHTLEKDMTLGHPLNYQGGEYAFVERYDISSSRGHVYLMDLMTGQYDMVEGYQSSISTFTPENSLVFIRDDNDTRPSYVIDPQTGVKFMPPKEAPYALDFTIAPDGQHFAYSLINTSVNISDLKGNDLTVDFKADAIIWGAKQYTVASETGDQYASATPTLVFYNTQLCGTLQPVGLVSGGQGRVIVGSEPNRIRVTPNDIAEVIGQIPEGAIFTVVSAQTVCTNKMRWVHVQYQNLDGWTAEGADGKAFLEPVQ